MCGSLLVWLFLRSNDPHCNLFSQHQRENRGWRQSPQKGFGTFGKCPFWYKEETARRALSLYFVIHAVFVELETLYVSVMFG